jgi:hypothetical protein
MKCNTLYVENYKYVVMILVLLTPILERGAVSKGGLGTLEHEASFTIILTQCSCGAFQLHKISFW